jgi:hypothetical protein
MSHTKEPWACRVSPKKGRGAEIISSTGHAIGQGDHDGNVFFEEEDARRIVDCVNACAGISDVVLKIFTGEDTNILLSNQLANDKLKAVEGERDDCLKECAEALNDPTLNKLGQIATGIRDLIAGNGPENIWELALLNACQSVIRANQNNSGNEPSVSVLACRLDELLQIIADNDIGHKASPVVAAPDGWMLVPMKLTRDMSDAGFAAGNGNMHKAWEQMLSASPKPPAQYLQAEVAQQGEIINSILFGMAIPRQDAHEDIDLDLDDE